MAAKRKMTRLLITVDSDALADLTELASYMAQGGGPNISETVRRLARWINSDLEKIRAMPAALPSRKSTHPEKETVIEPKQNSKSMLPPIEIHSLIRDKNDDWGDPPE